MKQVEIISKYENEFEIQICDIFNFVLEFFLYWVNGL